IARALVCNPAVIFADEPTGNLDSKSGNTVMQILQKLNTEGRTIILVTHEQETARHAKRIIRVRDGEIISDEILRERALAAVDTELIK
ncbi:MAG: macrolide ABC transporter ATP-binding protein, partial [Patescibacteria group bacterium]